MKNFFTRPLKPLTAYLLLSIFGVGIGLLLSSQCNAAEFKDGSHYQLTHASGLAHVTCAYVQNGRYYTRRATVNCTGSFAEPEAFSRFTHEGSDASTVQITNLTTNYTKSKKFYSSKGESSQFNLLVRTLFQKPLLTTGENNLKYSLLLKDGSVEEEGTFEVYVAFKTRQCRPIFIHSNNMQDCQGMSVCGRYFYEARCL